MSEKHWVRVWKITCSKEEYEEPRVTYQLDVGNDPQFYCDICGQEHNHIRGRGDEKHKNEIVGYFCVEDILKDTTMKIPKGWEDY
jgi:hypothetical protein